MERIISGKLSVAGLIPIGISKPSYANPCCRFEAFDEPWKIVYNTPTQGWEDKWGLLDPGTRALKPGLAIPDCGGKTVA